MRSVCPPLERTLLRRRGQGVGDVPVGAEWTVRQGNPDTVDVTPQSLERWTIVLPVDMIPPIRTAHREVRMIALGDLKALARPAQTKIVLLVMDGVGGFGR